MSKKQPRWLTAETGYPFQGQARFPMHVRYYKRATARCVKRLRLEHEGRLGKCLGNEFCYIIDGTDIGTCLTCGYQF